MYHMKSGVIYHFIFLPPAFASQTATADTLDAQGEKLDCLREYLCLSLLSCNRKKTKRQKEDTCLGIGAQIQRRFLIKGELEVLNSEDFECYGVAFLYGAAFSTFMCSSWALLFLQHIQENLNLLVLPDTFVIINILAFYLKGFFCLNNIKLT